VVYYKRVRREKMLNRITLKAHAKLNLCLDVIGKRQDGYHLLESIMQSISLFDVVTISKRKSGIEVKCSKLNIAEEKNIAYKAAKIFFEETGIDKGAKIKIGKKIPDKAGMGGGSADAAAVLIGLNKLYKAKLSETELCKIGEKIGADVPFCIKGGTQLVRGIGEVLTRLDDCPNCYFVIVKDNDGVSTKEAYEDLDNAFSVPSLRIEKVIEALSVNNLESLKGNLINVFEHTTRITSIKEAVEKLKSLGAIESAMTGSGSAVFGIFHKRKDAKKCYNQIKKDFCFSCVSSPSVNGVTKIF